MGKLIGAITLDSNPRLLTSNRFSRPLWRLFCLLSSRQNAKVKEKQKAHKGTEVRFVGFFLERATGIEPASPAWEAGVLPLDYARNTYDYITHTCLLSSHLREISVVLIRQYQSLKSKTALPFSNFNRPSKVFPVRLETKPVIFAVLPCSSSNLILETDTARLQIYTPTLKVQPSL